MNNDAIKKNVQRAVHELYRQYGISETEEDGLVSALTWKIEQSSELYETLINHPKHMDNMRYFVIREALLRREFFVETPLGKLRVHAKHEVDIQDDYPGVYVDLVSPGCPEEMLVCVEFNYSDPNEIMTTVYQPGLDEPCEIVHHVMPNLARIEKDTDGKLRYFDKNGSELRHRMKICWDDGSVETVYRSDDGSLGIDATNPVLVQKGKMNPCAMGIYPFTINDLKTIEAVG